MARSLTKFHGRPLSDATEQLEIRVMPKDIRNAVQCNSGECAIAQAVRRNQKILDVRIGARQCYVEFKDGWKRYDLGPAQAKKVKTFDIANYFEPGRYTLFPPKKALGTRVGETGTNVRGTGQKRSIQHSPSLRHV